MPDYQIDKSRDWSALEGIFPEPRLKLVVEFLTGDNGHASPEAWKGLRLNNRELAALSKHDSFDEYVLSRLAAIVLGIAHSDRVQLASIKLFLEWKSRFGTPKGPVAIDVE